MKLKQNIRLPFFQFQMVLNREESITAEEDEEQLIMRRLRLVEYDYTDSITTEEDQEHLIMRSLN